MTLTIVATVGSASANSFLTEAEQIAYMATRLNASTWTTVSGSTCTETEKSAMIEATRELSALQWQGTRVDTTQILSWPRSWVHDPDVTWFAWSYYATTIIPQRVKDATAELAFQFLKAGTTDIAALDPNVGLIEDTVDVLTRRWEALMKPTGLQRFPSVTRFINPMLLNSSGQPVLVRG